MLRKINSAFTLDEFGAAEKLPAFVFLLKGYPTLPTYGTSTKYALEMGSAPGNAGLGFANSE